MKINNESAPRYIVQNPLPSSRQEKVEDENKTIEKAIDDIWAEIKDYIAAKDSYQMTKKQEVVSKLMGVGFYKLSKEPETQLEVTRKK